MFTDLGLSGVVPPAQRFTIGFAGVSPQSGNNGASSRNFLFADNTSRNKERAPNGCVLILFPYSSRRWSGILPAKQ